MTLPSAKTTMRSAARRSKADLVRHHEQRHPVALQIFQHRQDFLLQLRIQSAGNFVAQQAPWLHGQRSGDRNALLLATRELTRIGVGAIGETDALQQAQAAFHRRRLVQLQDMDRCLNDVLKGRQVRK